MAGANGGSPRKMMTLDINERVVWVDGVCTVLESSEHDADDEQDDDDDESNNNDYPDTPSDSGNDTDSGDEQKYSHDEEDGDEDEEPFATRDDAWVRRQITTQPGLCHVCCNEYAQLYDAQNSMPIVITTLDAYLMPEELLVHVDDADWGRQLKDDLVLVAPCGNHSHSYCVGCIRTVAVTYVERTLMQTRGHIPCLSHTSHSWCQNVDGRPFVFAHHVLRYILSSLEVVHLSKLAARFDTSGEVAADSLNHYVWSPGKDSGLPFPALVPQSQIVAAKVAEQIKYIRTTDVPDVKCPECGVFLRKTMDCNCLSHCGIEICNICGYADVSIPSSHWKSCPRYELDTDWWIGATGLKCRDGHCTSETHECALPAHAAGRAASNELRKDLQMRALCRSLPADIQKQLNLV